MFLCTKMTNIEFNRITKRVSCWVLKSTLLINFCNVVGIRNRLKSVQQDWIYSSGECFKNILVEVGMKLRSFVRTSSNLSPSNSTNSSDMGGQVKRFDPFGCKSFLMLPMSSSHCCIKYWTVKDSDLHPTSNQTSRI